MARLDPQINIRQPRERYLILEVASVVHDKGTPGKLVQELVDEAIERYAKEASVQAVLAAREQQLAIDAGKVTPLRDESRLARSRANRGAHN